MASFVRSASLMEDAAEVEGNAARAAYHTERDLFIGACRRQPITSGHIDDGDLFTIRATHCALDTLHRHAGEVANALTHPGECVEKRAFPGIRVSNQRDPNPPLTRLDRHSAAGVGSK